MSRLPMNEPKLATRWRLAAYRALTGRPIRAAVARFGKALYNTGRLRFRNELAVNGELDVQRHVLELARSEPTITVLDVGANVGHWSQALADTARRLGLSNKVRLHAFEPIAASFERLERNLGDSPLDGTTLVRAAVSNETGRASMRVYGPTLGINSLEPSPAADDEPPDRQTVETITLHDYATRHGIDSVQLLKIDAEGHDLEVLRGARPLFVERRIWVAQFEYNARWIPGRYLLRDVFELVAELGYRVGFVTPRGVAWTERWEPELEDYYESNYLLVRDDLAHRLRAA